MNDNPLIRAWIGRTALAAAGVFAGSASQAALPVGAAAPDFSAAAALGGKTYAFSLAEALQRGPVVLYFYPKAYTTGCTAEAHDFAEATPQFNALGATVVGMSVDDIATLQRFSVDACRDKFAVATDPGGRIAQQYDAVRASASPMAARISYVISPQGRVLETYASSNPDEHVQRMLAAVEQWRRAPTP